MKETQLFVLGTLASRGPMHGHQIRRRAELERAEFWGKVKVSSLYAALHRLEDEGLIEALETRQEGRFPARTVYAITQEGRRELAVLLDACFRSTTVAAEPIDLALTFSGSLDEGYLRNALEERLAALRSFAESTERMVQQVRPYLTPVDEAVIRHFTLRLEAEVRWHQELLDQLPTLRDGKGVSTASADNASSSG
jgi:DNA-binding PadR family transcriptional regulator